MKRGRKSTVPWKRITRLVNQGMSYKAIGEQEHISYKTIYTHYKKRGMNSPTSKVHTYTPEEDKAILDCIGRNQLNIVASMEEASSLLEGITPYMVKNRWYNVLSLDEKNLIYLTESYGLVAANRKVAKRGQSLKIVPQVPSTAEKRHLDKMFLFYNFVTVVGNREFNTTSTDEFIY